MSIPYSALASVDDQQQAPPQLAPPQPQGPAPQPQAQPQQGIGYMGQPSRLKAMLSSGASALLHFAGVASPEELQLKQQEMEIQRQHAQAAMVQAQGIAALRQAQSGELQPISPEMAASLGHPEWSGIPMKQAMMNLAKPTVTAQGKIAAQQIANEGRMSVERMKAQLVAGQVSRLLPSEDGKFYRAFNKYGQEVGQIDNVTVKELLPKVSSTVDFKQQDDGSFVALPKSTVTQPMIPGRGGVSVSKGGKVAVPVFDAEGNPLKGLNATTSATRTMAEAAPKVQLFADRIDKLIDEQVDKLGPAAGRWNEFMAGKVGAPNPEFTKLRTDVGLMQTLLMRMHVGARGGEYIMKHFQDLIDSGKQSPENLKAAIGEIRQYAQDLQHHGAAVPKTTKSDPLGIR